MARVGLLGGTFNPPHIAHLVCAQDARWAFGLDRVDLVPVHLPPHKVALGDPGPQARLDLCRAAVEGNHGLGVDDIEVRREGPSWTVATLREIHATRPEDELTFIVGGDTAQSLPTWREPEEVLERATIAVAERDGVRRDDISERLTGLRGAEERVVFFDMPRLDVSSSIVRRRVAEGRPIRHLVPDAVARLIETRGYYGAATLPGPEEED